MHLNFQSGDPEVMRDFGILLKYATLFLGCFGFSLDKGLWLGELRLENYDQFVKYSVHKG